MRKNKAGITANMVINEINKILREPVYMTIKYLYPKLYRIDDINNSKGDDPNVRNFNFNFL
jgi:hypothetical protein